LRKKDKKKRKIHDIRSKRTPNMREGTLCDSFISLPLNFRRKSMGTRSVPI